MHEGFKSIFGHVCLSDDRSFIISQEILGVFKHNIYYDKTLRSTIYNFEYSTCHIFHPFRLEVFNSHDAWMSNHCK